ncbi:hypothetical protein ACB496_15480 [Lelliottia nimipressuralis]|uniref:hypothetical protein n=1 Tax=Lelliottia nimipressuralis TaxID=69220 RepID=UPI003557D295
MQTKAITIMLMLTAGPSVAGVYSGDQTVTGTLIVGGAASCSAAIAEQPLTNTITRSALTNVGTLTVTCPGAASTLAGLIADDGAVVAGLTSSNGNSSAAGGYLQMLRAVNSTKDVYSLVILQIDSSSADANYLKTDPTDLYSGLPPNVLSVIHKSGETGSYTINFSASCNGTPTCQLNTGSYSYRVKVYGYWS